MNQISPITHFWFKSDIQTFARFDAVSYKNPWSSIFKYLLRWIDTMTTHVFSKTDTVTIDLFFGGGYIKQVPIQECLAKCKKELLYYSRNDPKHLSLMLYTNPKKSTLEKRITIWLSKAE